jgi:predicted metal-dependent hydrolase
MPVACRNCQADGLVCQVHVQSGRCSECNRKNSKTCNIRVSANEWVVIREERECLLARREAIQKEEAEVEKALRENANQATEAISVKEANITLLEQQETSASLSDGLEMSPST